MKNKIKVIIIDDHPVVTSGMKKILDLEEDISVAGIFNSIKEAKENIKDIKASIALVDLNFKDGPSGLQLVSYLKSNYPETRSIVFSMFDERIHAKRAIEAGAYGYVMKHMLTDVVIEAIRSVFNGKFYLSEEMNTLIISEYGGHKSTEMGYDLTIKEFEIVRLIGLGKTNQETAQMLNVSVKTIESHKTKIKEKIDIKSSAEFFKFCIDYMREE